MKIEEAKIRFEEIETYTHGFYDDVLIKKRDAKVLLDQIELDQPKPVVPKFVADWIEDHKGDYSKWDEEARADFVFRAINDLFRFGEDLYSWDFTIDEKISEWTTKNAYEFITAILFGYTVEKEKLYTVEIPNPNRIGNEANVLMMNSFKQVVIVKKFGEDWKKEKGYQLTEEEIRKDFDWAWQQGFMKEVTE
ncbi:hypothetical protein Javan425_0032 [Streptococcus phage Javan425]|uniref:Phage protein n=1 Tax=Streptococcus porcinus str. Jelinkova 176 TaxID=873448 RepID=A0ABN0CWX5_STRPO|nr:DUF1642 domain-containing protein [Streptococcus porcinus]EGJ27675.1 hypothetical protein STRPO_0272 [Streptococcus porcinus str. Jelinkova 176]QBX18374.1 hypothetical protein Javan423_0028 [Streptococcus phage Javan423]QBX18437.1 hypothetical protein Javan425_0032 [Streptococcus phage Javan425]SQG43968.1 phage protein [Streptococcus porcinus]